MRAKIAEAFASRKDDARAAWEATRESVQLIRESAPTLTTVVAVVLLLLGAFAGWWASAWWTRWAVNAEWRERIAAQSAAVRNVVETGDAEITATDDDIIKALGDTDAKLVEAQRKLNSFKPAASVADRCRVPAECLRR